MTDEATANPATGSETAPSTFKERAMARMASEGDLGPPPGYETPDNPEPSESDSVKVGEGYEEALDPARQAEEAAEAEPETPTAEDEPTTEAVPETSEDADTSTEVDRLRAERDEARDLRAQMERDYRIKGHQNGQYRRQLEAQAQTLEGQYQQIVGAMNAGVERLQGLDWTTLQTKPEEYQQAQMALAQATKQRDAWKEQLDAVKQANEKAREDALTREAAINRDFLKASLPGWNEDFNGRLEKVTQFLAKDWAYTPEELNELTDWRVISMAEQLRQLSEAPPTVAQRRTKHGKPPAQREQQTAQPRNARGQFEKSRKALWDNPGDRGARSQFFRDKLARERGR